MADHSIHPDQRARLKQLEEMQRLNPLPEDDLSYSFWREESDDTTDHLLESPAGD